MNPNVKNDLKDEFNAKDFEIIEKIIKIVETSPDKKQKELIRNQIEEAIQ